MCVSISSLVDSSVFDCVHVCMICSWYVVRRERVCMLLLLHNLLAGRVCDGVMHRRTAYGIHTPLVSVRFRHCVSIFYASIRCLFCDCLGSHIYEWHSNMRSERNNNRCIRSNSMEWLATCVRRVRWAIWTKHWTWSAGERAFICFETRYGTN